MPYCIVNITPTTAVTNGAKWHIAGYPGWYESGDSVYILSSGDYTISFRDAQGYVTPEDITVSLGAPVSITTTAVVYSSLLWNPDWGAPTCIGLFRGQVICGGPGAIVRWSEIGSFAFLGQTAKATKNTAGEWYVPGPEDTEVMRITEMKDSILVYTNHAVWRLTPVKEPAPTFSPSRIGETGILQPLAVDGNENENIYVTEDGFLHSINYGKYNILADNRLGYQEFFKDMQTGFSMDNGDGIAVVTYNHNEKEYYISSDRMAFLYKEGILTGCNRAVTSIIKMYPIKDNITNYDILSDYPLGAFIKLDSNNVMMFETDVIDFNLSAIKTLETVELNGSLGSTNFAEVSIKWRMQRGDFWRQTKWKRVSPFGFVAPLVSATDFKILVRYTPLEGVNINSITVGWKISDKHSIRGNPTK